MLLAKPTKISEGREPTRATKPGLSRCYLSPKKAGPLSDRQTDPHPTKAGAHERIFIQLATKILFIA